ncbi:hypothetical protein V3C99_011193 [Haemonchus contortus]
MSAKAGFDYSNQDQKERKEKTQETVNRAVLSKLIRIVSVPNPDKLSMKELATKFLNEIIMYDRTSDANPLSWLRSAGNNSGTSSFRAEMSSTFWDFYLEKGRKNLNDYNRKHLTNIRIIRGQTIKVGDLENLSLYLRKRIRSFCIDTKRRPPEILIKNGVLIMKNGLNEKRMRCTELAIKLGWSYEDWNGIPIKELMSEEERKAYEDGKLVWGSFHLETFLSESISQDQGQPSTSVNEEKRSSRKRVTDIEETVQQKLPRRTADDI